MVQDIIHRQIVRNFDRVEDWFRQIRQQVDAPFYSSYDIRDSGFKVTNVDANIFPAGFNNICRVDRENGGRLVRQYIDQHYSENLRRVVIVTEEHTQNRYYWDNVVTLQQMISDGGLEVKLAIPRSEVAPPFLVESASYGKVEVHSAVVRDGVISVDDQEPELVISNNDFSNDYEEWGSRVDTPVNPPRELGWYQRKKSLYFHHYNQLCTEFSQVAEIDPWLLTVETELFGEFNMADEVSRERLAERVDQMLERIRAEYQKRGVADQPVVFVKNNSGTYGLAVMRVQSGEEIRKINYKGKKKMKAAKGGREVEEVVIQEGVPSSVTAEGVTAEPAIYLVGCRLAGGFLRAHGEKGPTESLNSPGAVFKRLCVSDLEVSVEGHPLENVYGWVAKLGLLAIGKESAELNVHYSQFERRFGSC